MGKKHQKHLPENATPVEGAELSVALADAEDSWVSNLAINETDGTVTFDVAENDSIREMSAVVIITS